MKTIFLLLAVIGLATTHVCAQTNFQWNGSISSNWFDAQNWDQLNVPTSNDNVIIATGTFTPILTNDVTVHNIEIQNGASLDAAGFIVDVNGNWNNQGNFIAGSGTVIFSGISNQQISGNTKFYQLIINNEAGVANSSGCDSIEYLLNIQYGFFETNDSLYFLSSLNKTASLGSMEYGNIYGQITFQRHIDNSIGGWRFLSFPIQSGSLNQLEDDILTSGFPGSTLPTETFVSVYYYDETDTGDAYYGYEVPISIDDTLNAGQGFMIYLDPNNLVSKVDFRGYPVIGSVDVPLTYTLSDTISDGWNLVGNPYPSAFDWDHASIYKQNLDEAIYVWDPVNAIYTSYINGIGTNGGSNIIASGQSFYVKTNASNPKLLLDENSKVTEDSTYFKTTESTEILKLKMQNSYGADETVITINPDASTTFDKQYDALKMFSMDYYKPAIYTMDENQEYYSIHASSNTELHMPVYVYTAISENHVIEISGVETFDAYSCIFLEDLHTGISYNLREVNTINVFISDTNTSARFLIKLGAPVYVAANDVKCYNENNGEIQIAKNGEELMDISIFDMYGSLLHQTNNVYQIAEFDGLYPGIYAVAISSNLCGSQVDTLQIFEPNEITVDFEILHDTIKLINGIAEITPTNNSVNATNYLWNFGNGITSSVANPNGYYTVSGTYEITLTASQNSQCYETMNKTVVVAEASANTSGLDDEQQNEITFYTSDNSLIINSPTIGTVSIYNMNGSLIATYQLISGLQTIPLILSADIYLVHIVSKENLLTGKISVY